MKKSKITDNLARKYLIKIESSGINLAQAKTLGFSQLSADAMRKLGHREVPGFKLPYYDSARKPLKFYRVRYLEDTVKGFAKQTNAKNQRYDQPSGASPEVYLPAIWKRKWVEEFKLDTPLFVTEGELKAACACIYGIPTIALGGVWNFCARKRGINILPVFKEMNLKGRNVYIVFDSDAVTNPEVAKAENAFCKELLALGAYPYIIRLPSIGDKKIGLDDYLIAKSKAEFDVLVEEAKEYRLAAELHRMNEEVIYVENPSLVLRHKDNLKMGVPTFKNEVFANRTFIDFSGDKPKKVATANEWVKWESRAQVSGIDYKPGQDHLLHKDNNTYINVWKPLPVQAIKGDVSPWHTLMEYVFEGAPEMRLWFERWLAYPLQNPGVKLFTAVAIWSVDTGTGKTLIGHTMQRIYGENSIMVNKKDLTSGDNSFAENKQFVLGEEITGDDKRNVADNLKGIITNEEMRINIKYVPVYSIMSCANYMFTSNNPDAFFLDEKDRRMFIWEIIGEKLSRAFYRGIYDPWYKSQAGIDALYYYFMNLDLGDFDFSDEAPITGAKEEMIENSRSVLANWVHTLRDNPDKVLAVGNAAMNYDLWTTDDLLKMFDPEDKKRVGVRGMGVELKRARVAKAAKGMGCRSIHGQVRLWAVRNPPKYVHMQPTEVGKLYDSERDMTKKPKYSKQGRKK